VDKPLLSVTHGQCDARLTGYLLSRSRGLEPGASHGDELSMVTWSSGQRHEQLRGRLVTRDTSLHCLTVLWTHVFWERVLFV